MHRPVINWEKLKRIEQKDSPESRVYNGTQKLLQIRRKLKVLADGSNLTWLTPHNIHTAAFMRADGAGRLFCLFNFSTEKVYITWYTFKERGDSPVRLFDHWQEKYHTVGADHEYLILEPYSFCLMEPA